MFLIILQVYFFTQLNFDLVSHNFGTKIDNFIDNVELKLQNIKTAIIKTKVDKQSEKDKPIIVIYPKNEIFNIIKGHINLKQYIGKGKGLLSDLQCLFNFIEMSINYNWNLFEGLFLRIMDYINTIQLKTKDFLANIKVFKDFFCEFTIVSLDRLSITYKDNDNLYIFYLLCMIYGVQGG